MDSEGKIRSEILDNNLVYTGLPGWAYFRQKRVIFIYGLLGLSYLLILTFFIIVLSRDSKSGSSQTEVSTALSKIKNDVANITQKLDKLQKTFKDSVGCDNSEWISFSDSCYYFSITKSNWMKARSFCVRKGSDLVAITSEREQRFLSSKVNQKNYWIGLNEDDGNWTLVDGTDYKTLIKFWKKGEPSKSDKVNCAYIETNGDWLAIPCSSNEIYAICEKKTYALTS